MKNETGEFGIIIPIHNGRNHIEPLLNALESTLEIDCRLVLVDDGSTDESWELIQRIAENPRPGISICGLKLDRNRGQQSALIAGLTACRDIPVITMDDDLSHPPELMPDLLAALETGAELAYADPPLRPGGTLRRMASVLHRRHMTIITGSSPDTGVGSYRSMAAGLTARILESPASWSYLSAMALGLRPAPVTVMVPSPAWQTGAAGRIRIASLLKMELNIGIHYGFPARLFRRILAGRQSIASVSTVAGSWIVERTER